MGDEPYARRLKRPNIVGIVNGNVCKYRSVTAETAIQAQRRSFLGVIVGVHRRAFILNDAAG